MITLPDLSLLSFSDATEMDGSSSKRPGEPEPSSSSGAEPKKPRGVYSSVWRQIITQYKQDPSNLASADREFGDSEGINNHLRRPQTEKTYRIYKGAKAIEAGIQFKVTQQIVNRKSVIKAVPERLYLWPEVPVLLLGNTRKSCVDVEFHGSSMKLHYLFFQAEPRECKVAIGDLNDRRGYGEFVLEMLAEVASDCGVTKITVDDAAQFGDKEKAPLVAYELNMQQYLRLTRGYGYYEKQGYFAKTNELRGDATGSVEDELEREVREQNRQLEWTHTVATTKIKQLRHALDNAIRKQAWITPLSLDEREEREKYVKEWLDEAEFDALTALESCREELNNDHLDWGDLTIRELLHQVDTEAAAYKPLVSTYTATRHSYSVGAKVAQYCKRWMDDIQAADPTLHAKVEFVLEVISAYERPMFPDQDAEDLYDPYVSERWRGFGPNAVSYYRFKEFFHLPDGRTKHCVCGPCATVGGVPVCTAQVVPSGQFAVVPV